MIGRTGGSTCARHTTFLEGAGLDFAPFHKPKVDASPRSVSEKQNHGLEGHRPRPHPAGGSAAIHRSGRCRPASTTENRGRDASVVARRQPGIPRTTRVGAETRTTFGGCLPPGITFELEVTGERRPKGIVGGRIIDTRQDSRLAPQKPEPVIASNTAMSTAPSAGKFLRGVAGERFRVRIGRYRRRGRRGRPRMRSHGRRHRRRAQHGRSLLRGVSGGHRLCPRRAASASCNPPWRVGPIPGKPAHRKPGLTASSRLTAR